MSFGAGLKERLTRLVYNWLVVFPPILSLQEFTEKAKITSIITYRSLAQF